MEDMWYNITLSAPQFFCGNLGELDTCLKVSYCYKGRNKTSAESAPDYVYDGMTATCGRIDELLNVSWAYDDRFAKRLYTGSQL